MPAQSGDPFHLCCEWISAGERCRYPGAFSDGTLGNGPWYCSSHRLCHDLAAGAIITERSIVDCGQTPDYSYEARRAAFLAKPQPQPSNSPLVSSIRAAYHTSQHYRDKHHGNAADLLPQRLREPGED
jgi:hypothetical protein